MNYFYADIGNNDAFKFFKYKTKSLANTTVEPVPNNNSGISKNATITKDFFYDHLKCH